MLNLGQVSGAAADGIRAAGLEVVSQSQAEGFVALNVAEVGQEATVRVVVQGIAQPTEQTAPGTTSREPSQE